MNDIEQAIFSRLTELDQQVRAIRASGARPDLQPLFAQLEALAGELPLGSNPDLLHYLRKKSYEKARLLLAGREAENRRGSCDS
jgi:hypothetical protein